MRRLSLGSLLWYDCLFPLFLGHMLDTLARTALWDAGLDYLHGTGHGVGAFLNVHEGLFILLQPKVFILRFSSVAPMAEWLRLLIFSALNCSPSHRCGLKHS